MIQSIKNHPINWTDGMKISEKHFIAHDHFLVDTIRDANSIRCNSYNYGLLPINLMKSSEENIFDVNNSATNDVQVVIKHCSAITAAGFRIDITDYRTSIRPLIKIIEDKEEMVNGGYYILIYVNPFEQLPFGDIDPEEIPPRQPFTKSKFNVELISESIIEGGGSGGNYLIIGKVNINNAIAEADNTFIPPCTNVHSHPELLKFYNSFAQAMGNLQQHALIINQKTVSTNQNSTLANNVKAICNTLVNHIANVYFDYRNIVPQQPPIFMIEVFSSMALHINNVIQTLAKGELEEVLNYSFEWSEVAPHVLLNQLTDVIEIHYNHNRCGEHLITIQRLLGSLVTIFTKLSSLDYIGQRKENIIVNDTDITPKTNVKKGWSLLD